MNNLLPKKIRFLYKITSFILILSTLNTLTANALEPSEHTLQQEITNVSNDTDTNDELKEKFQSLSRKYLFK